MKKISFVCSIIFITLTLIGSGLMIGGYPGYNTVIGLKSIFNSLKDEDGKSNIGGVVYNSESEYVSITLQKRKDIANNLYNSFKKVYDYSIQKIDNDMNLNQSQKDTAKRKLDLYFNYIKSNKKEVDILTQGDTNFITGAVLVSIFGTSFIVFLVIFLIKRNKETTNTRNNNK